MTAVPSTWARAKLGDLADFHNGAAFKPTDWSKEGTPIIRIQNLTDPLKPLNRTKRSVNARHRVGDGDILVSWSATLDVFIWGRGDAWLNQHIFRVVPNEGRVRKDYLFYVLRHEIAALLKTEHLHGSTMKHINRGPFLAHRINLPPLSEQDRIVKRLGHLLRHSTKARAELDRVPVLVDRYLGAIFSAAYDGGLTADWRAARDLPASPLVTLGSVASELSYGSSAKSAKAGKVPVVRMGNIQNGAIDLTDLVYTSDAEEIRKYRLATGDVLFNRTNSPALVGKSAMYLGDRAAIYAGYLIRVRCSESLNPAYLTYCLNSPAGRQYCWQVKTDGVSQSNINAKKLAAFPLPLPSMDEQIEIVRKIEEFRARVETLKREADAPARLLARLEHAVTAKAFGACL